ncbi:putative laccase-11 [Hordeum vulgare]|nr:putative laccase-11 [Hordeum vulgare]
MVRRLITTYAHLTPERRLQIEVEIQARRVARIIAGLPTDSRETKEDEEQEQEEELKAMVEDDLEEEAPGLSMADEKAEFAVAQSKEMAEHHTILDSIRDEAEVETNRRLIRQRQAEADALFDELEAKIEVEEAAAEQSDAPKGAELRHAAIYPPEDTEIVNIFDEE